MLKIEAGKKVWHENVLDVIIVTVVVLAVLILAAQVFQLWTREICGQVSIADYSTGNAPGKCAQLWKEGRL